MVAGARTQRGDCSAGSEVLRRESITSAFLLLLEKLSPVERGAFLLREIFDYEYAEVARVLETSEVAARQLVHRARERIAQGKRRFQSQPDRQREVVRRFLAAARDGEIEALEALLAEDVTYTADGGGKAIGARRVIEGASAVARVFAVLYEKAYVAADKWRIEISELNGETALVGFYEGLLDGRSMACGIRISWSGVSGGNNFFGSRSAALGPGTEVFGTL